MVRPFISCLMSTMLVSGAAVAQDRDDARFSPDRPSPWAFEFGAGTDNRSKGASKNGDAPYDFGEVQWITASGFYADAEFETIDPACGSSIHPTAWVRRGPRPGWKPAFAGPWPIDRIAA